MQLEENQKKVKAGPKANPLIYDEKFIKTCSL
jgi:hypothetical protein